MSIEIRSDAFNSGEEIPIKYTGDGQNISPPLKWSGVPSAAVELALIVDDPDAPREKPFVHWVLYKIPPQTPGVPQTPQSHRAMLDDLNGALQGENSKGEVGYLGPAPPPGHGTHHYHFHLYALDQPLKLESGADSSALRAAMAGHILDEGKLIGTYQR
jgi:Raf kinase inhibitor-like YbhB/YbcL family protein